MLALGDLLFEVMGPVAKGLQFLLLAAICFEAMGAVEEGF